LSERATPRQTIINNGEGVMGCLHDQYNQTTVLIVDDYPLTRLILGHILERGGYRVIVESSCCGGEALDKYLRCRPEITVLDTSVRRESGLAMAREILVHDAAAVIILCDFDAGEVGAWGKATGACGVLVKPYDSAQVLRVMRAASEIIPGQLPPPLLWGNYEEKV
jgi:DNA-binding response OmpR family regulator